MSRYNERRRKQAAGAERTGRLLLIRNTSDLPSSLASARATWISPVLSTAAPAAPAVRSNASSAMVTYWVCTCLNSAAFWSHRRQCHVDAAQVAVRSLSFAL